VVRPWPGGEKRRGGRASHYEEYEAMGAFLLPCAVTEVSLLAVWCLIGATPRGSAVDNCRATPQRRDGLSARQMAVLWAFREPSRCRHVRRESATSGKAGGLQKVEPLKAVRCCEPL
jgi:hypothetical protein